MKNNKSQKINTVSVIEILNGIVDNIVSFKDNHLGNKEAEKLFEQKALENGMQKEFLEDCLDKGGFDDQNGYDLIICHSI